MNRFNKRLRAAMLAAGMDTPAQLAQALGVPTGTVQRWLRSAEADLSAKHLHAVALALKIRMRWLVDGNGPPDETVMADDNVAACLIILSRLTEENLKQWLEDGLRMMEET